jgi:hypothetical protein
MDIGSLNQASLANLYFGGYQLVEEKIIIAQTVDVQQTSASYGVYNIGKSPTGQQVNKGQAFIATASLITAVEVREGNAKTGTPSGNWTLRIETDDGSGGLGKPSGTLANANASIVVTPPGTNTIIKGTFAIPFYLTIGTRYWIVITCDTQTTNNFWNISGSNIDSNYTLGALGYRTDGTWNNIFDTDQLYFKIYVNGAQTAHTFSGLNGDVDEEYRLVSRVVTATGDGGINLTFNTDTGANYGIQYLRAIDTTASAYRGVLNSFTIGNMGTTTGPNCLSDVIIYAKSGYVRTAIRKSADYIATTTVNRINMWGCSWNNTADNITQIVLTADNANGLGVGTQLLLFKKTLTGLAATTGLKTGKLNVIGNINCGVMQKIYDNTLAAAAQSVNITGLNGDVDTIYELIIRNVIGANSTAPLISPNGDTNGSNYGGQRLRWQNTTVSAGRQVGNGGFYLLGYGTGSAGNLWMCSGLIFAKSGYLRTGIFEGFCDINGTTIDGGFLRGEVWTNTADNITSILIDSQVANGWGIGTHFELWCLKKKI